MFLQGVDNVVVQHMPGRLIHQAWFLWCYWLFCI